MNESWSDLLALESKPPVVILEEYAAKTNTFVKFEFIRQNVFQHNSLFEYNLKFNDHEVTGIGKSKKNAKNNAAFNMLKIIFDKSQEKDSIRRYKPLSNNCADINYVEKLYEMCLQNELEYPEYNLIETHGAQNGLKFVFSCRIGDIIEMASAKTKTKAIHLVASQIVNKLILQKSKTKLNVFDLSMEVLDKVEVINSKINKDIIDQPSTYHLLFEKNEWLRTDTLNRVVEHFYRDGKYLLISNPYDVLMKITAECKINMKKTATKKSLTKKNIYFHVLTIENIYPPISGMGINEEADVADFEAATELLKNLCLLYI